MKLYEIAQHHRALVEHIANTDLDDDAKRDTIEAESNLSEKMEACAMRRREIQADIDARQKEIDRLEALNQSDSNADERLKDYMTFCLRLSGETKIKTTLFSIWLQKTESIIFDNEDLVPRDYWTSPEPPKPKPSKSLVSKAIKDGYSVPGARVENGVSLRIR